MDAFDWKYFQIRNAVINIKTSVSFHVISNNRRIKNKTFFFKSCSWSFYWSGNLLDQAFETGLKSPQIFANFDLLRIEANNGKVGKSKKRQSNLKLLFWKFNTSRNISNMTSIWDAKKWFLFVLYIFCCILFLLVLLLFTTTIISSKNNL